MQELNDSFNKWLFLLYPKWIEYKQYSFPNTTEDLPPLTFYEYALLKVEWLK